MQSLRAVAHRVPGPERKSAPEEGCILSQRLRATAVTELSYGGRSENTLDAIHRTCQGPRQDHRRGVDAEITVSYFLSSLPLWLLIALIVVTPTALAMVAQTLIHKRVGVAGLAKNNEIAGFKFATVGVIYAVLLAFAVIVVWEKFNDAQSAVANEAGATAALFHYAHGKEPEAMAVRTALAGYLKAAIEDEWPAMARETESPATEHALDSLYAAAIALSESGTRGTADMTEVFRQLDNVTAARRIRLHLATGLVPNVIWSVLFTGALLTVGFTLFFGSENLLAQVSMTGVLSVLVTMGLVVIISIDHPFTGPVYIHPDALALVLSDHEPPK